DSAHRGSDATESAVARVTARAGSAFQASRASHPAQDRAGPDQPACQAGAPLPASLILSGLSALFEVPVIERPGQSTLWRRAGAPSAPLGCTSLVAKCSSSARAE